MSDTTTEKANDEEHWKSMGLVLENSRVFEFENTNAAAS